MDAIANIAYEIPEIEPVKVDASLYYRMREQWHNEKAGNLLGYNCTKCLNRGNFLRIDEFGNEFIKECECMATRRNFKAIEYSGLVNLVSSCTFDAFKAEEEWQKELKRTAWQFANDDSDYWLYVSGISGSGKTHICTAVCKHLMEKGRTVKYMLWSDINHKLDSNKYNDEEYNRFMRELKSVDILYIDDFAKTTVKGNAVTDLPLAEIKNAYNVINARYLANKKTIISSELFITDLISLDCAVGGRIKQKSGKYLIQIKREDSRNYRLRK